MTNPYFGSILETDVTLHPNQMDNNIYDHIKENLSALYLRKCFKDHGYVVSIYGLDGQIKGGYIRAEDTSCSSTHKVRFKCKICNPIKDRLYVAKITGINKMLIILYV